MITNNIQSVNTKVYMESLTDLIIKLDINPLPARQALRVAMIEKRKFHRVKLTAKCMQSHHNTIYWGQLEKISLNGALIRFEQGIKVSQSVEYNLKIEIEGEDVPLQFVVEVVCATYSLTGIQFISSEPDTEARLSQLVEALSKEPDKVRTEIHRFQNIWTTISTDTEFYVL